MRGWDGGRTNGMDHLGVSRVSAVDILYDTYISHRVLVVGREERGGGLVNQQNCSCNSNSY